MAGYIGSKASVVSSGVERKKTYSITGSTTSLTGLNYTVGKVHVYQNGVRLLDGTDYTATNGTSITLTVAAQSGDNVVVVSQASFQLSESYTSTEADARYVQPTHTGNLNITGTVTSDGLTVDGTIQTGLNQPIDVRDGVGDVSLRLSSISSGANAAAIKIDPDNTGASSALEIQMDGTNKVAKFFSGGDISFYEDTGTTAKFFWDASAERLGIGEASPATDLHITNSGTTQLLLKSGNTSQGILLFGDAEDLNVGSLTYDHSDNSMRFETSDTERMRIDSSGNVGIGTSSPTRQLDVSKAGTAYIRASDTANSVNMEMLAASSGGWIGTQTNHSLNFQTNNTERMRIDASGVVKIGGQTGTLQIGNDATYYADIEWEYNNNELAFSTNSGANFTFNSGGTERMRIDSSGRVTKPNQPAFFAHRNGGNYTETNATAKVYIDGTKFNHGGHYDTTNNRFVAPVDGAYQFNASVNCYYISSGKQLRAFFYVNGSTYVVGDSFHSANNAHDLVASISHVIYLSANDYVEVWSYSDDGSRGFSSSIIWNTFSGYLLG